MSDPTSRARKKWEATRLQVPSRPRGRPPMYTDRQMIRYLQEACGDGLWLSKTAYESYREDKQRPTSRAIEYRFGSWNNALDAAGIWH